MRSGTTTNTKTLIALALATALLCAGAQAQVTTSIKIDVLTDLSSGYSDREGAGCSWMVRLAVEEFGGKVRGQPVEVVWADPQNKPEIGVSIGTKWFDEGVDAVVPGSAQRAWRRGAREV